MNERYRMACRLYDQQRYKAASRHFAKAMEEVRPDSAEYHFAEFYHDWSLKTIEMNRQGEKKIGVG
jgi:hypothetical protein